MDRIAKFILLSTMIWHSSAALAQEAPLLDAEPQIAWRVDNPFRFFRSSAAADIHRRTYANLTERELSNPIRHIERRLGKQFPLGWANEVFQDTCWNRDENNFTPCSRKQSYFKPTQHKIVARLSTHLLERLSCTWLVTPKNKKRKPQIVRANCDEVVNLSIPFPAGAQVSVSAAGQPVASANIKIRDLFVVSMGDSFASGEGNPDRPVQFSSTRQAEYGVLPSGEILNGLPARKGNWNKIGDDVFRQSDAVWLSTACHRSLYSHHVRAALHLALEDPHRAITFASYACAGAEIEKGLFLRYKGASWTPNPPRLSQISAVAQAQCGGQRIYPVGFPHAYHMKNKLPDLHDIAMNRCPRRSARAIDLMFLSIGGNDIGFAGLVGNAILSDASKLRQVGGWLGAILTEHEANDRLRNLPVRYRALNRAIHNILHIPWKQSDRVILTAYPLLATRSDKRSICPSTRLGLSIFPDFKLDADRAKKSANIANKLYRIQQETARKFGWTFVDEHRQQFAGHSVCSGNWEIEASIADDLRVPRMVRGEWHPYNPALYRPYAPRRRWFRTPNDAYMTANSHLHGAEKLLNFQKLSWFQLLFASTYSGAFHPNAEGQAAMADALVRQSRAILTKYRAIDIESRKQQPMFFSDNEVSSGPVLSR